jgi:TolB protein
MSLKKSNLSVIVLTIGLLFSCSESSTSPDTDNNGEEETNSAETESTNGVLETHISATGSDLDTDGYMLILNGSEEKSAATEDTVFFGDLDEGSHEIELTEIADNCSTQGDNPKSFDISADDTTDVEFTVECESLGPAPLANAIVYTSTGESGGYSKIYVMNEDGSEPVLLHEVEGSNVLHPDISPDGTRIIFSTSGESLFDQFIYVMNSDGSEVTQLTTESDDANDFAPVWSPDGSEILFERDNDLFVMNDDGSDQTNITNTEEYFEWDPEWSPDGTEIVYRRGTDDNHDQDEGNIIIANADGSEPRLLTETAADIDGEPGLVARWRKNCICPAA